MKKDDWKRERNCTRKRAFSTEFYAECVAINEIGMNPEEVEAYRCRYCDEFHLKDAPRLNAKRRR